MSKNKTYYFEIFCIDPGGKTAIQNEKSLVHALMFSNKLWSDEVRDTSEHSKWSITDKKNKLSVKIKSVDTSKVLTGFFEAAFIVKIESEDFDAIEPFRVKILKPYYWTFLKIA